MIKKSFFKSMLVITGLLWQFNLSAQVPPITLHVEIAGTLSSLIAESQKYEIADLTLTGNLDSRDIRFLREMAGSDFQGRATLGRLENLDLSGANIVSYGWTVTSTDQYSIGYNTCYYQASVYVPNQVSDRYRYTHYHSSNNIMSDYMFYNCTKLKNITIPNSVTSIGAYAFSGCSNLTNVTIGNRVTVIGERAFSGCTGLTSITIPNSATAIGKWAFSDCFGLTSVTYGEYITIANSVAVIGERAFSGCSNLTNVTIGNSVTVIEESAFAYCKGLTSLTIGNDVTVIGERAFSGCTGLTSITIPNSVTAIGKWAFSGCAGLKSVTIGKSMTSIEDGAFYNCTKLTEIHSKNPYPPTSIKNCFSGVNIRTTCILYVPKGSKSVYQIKPIWKEFNNIIEVDDVSISSINKDNIIIQSGSNGIAIETKEPTSVSVYTLSGQKVYQSVIIGNTEIRLNKGVYIVRINNESQKVIVK